MNFSKETENTNPYPWLFLLLLAFYCTWILTLPLFPSLDGSLHLYYASVLGSLLSGSGQFSSYYFVRHVLPPYALHYYFLIAAAHLFGYVIAEKVMICLIFLTTAFGFRYLATYLGPGGELTSLLMVPLLLNWPLGMGFYNYCLSTGIALWALGIWYRAVARRSHGMWLAFLAAVVLMVLTHPVPVLFVYVLIGSDVALRVYLRSDECKNTRHFKHLFGWDICYMLLAWSTLLYIILFMGRQRVVANILQVYDRKAVFIKVVKLSTLAMFSGSRPLVILYRISLYGILILAILLASSGLWKRIQRKASTPADIILIFSLLLLLAIPILPPVMNGANYFSQRLMILVWIGSLAAASGHPRFSPRARLNLLTLVSVYGVTVLLFANMMIRPTAAEISRIEKSPIQGKGMKGLILSLSDAPDPSGLNYVPYYWAGARYFRRSRSILLNGGWLYEYYLPLGSRVKQLTNTFTPAIQDSPGDAYRLLLSSGTVRAQVMPNTDLVVFTGEENPEALLEILHKLDGKQVRAWKCQPEIWYSVCTTPKWLSRVN